MNAFLKNLGHWMVMGVPLLLSGCNLGFVSFETNGPENFSSDGDNDPRSKIAKNLSVVGPSLLEAGVCAQLTIQAEANDGSTQLVKSDVVIELGLASGAGAKFYSDEGACSADSGTTIFGTMSQVTIAEGSSSVGFFVRSLGHNPFTVVALSQQLGFNSLPLNVRATPKQLAFTTAPNSIKGGRCESGNLFRVEVRDGLGSPVPGSNLSVRFTSTVGGTFRTSCGGSPITELAFPLASRDVYFETDSTQTTVVGAEVVGNSSVTSASKTVTILRVADDFVLTRANNNEDLGECSATPVRVQVLDSAGVALSSHGGFPIRIDAVDGDARFYDTQVACTNDNALSGGNTTLNTTIADGSSEKLLYFRATELVAPAGSAVRNLDLRIRVRNVTDSHFAARTADVNVVRDPRILSLSGPASVSAGLCSSAFTATIKDRMGRNFLTSGETVNLVGGGNGSYYGAAGCGGGTVGSLAFGASATKNFFTKNDTIENDVLVRVESAKASISPAELVIDSEPAVVAVRLTATAGGNVDLGGCYAYTVETLDAGGNPVSGDPKTISITLPVGSHKGRGFLSPTACANDPIATTTKLEVTVPNVSGSKNFYFRATALSSVTLRASLPGGSDTDDLTKTVVQTAKSLSLTPAGAQSLTVDLCHPTAFAVSVLDGIAQPFSSHGGVTVGLSNPGDGSYFSDNGCQNGLTGNQLTINNGSISGNLYILPTAQRAAFDLIASAAGLSDSNGVSVQYVVTPFGLHTDFNGTGSVELNLTAFSADQGVDLIQLSDSNLLAVGLSNDAGFDAIGLAKLDPNGLPVATFVGGGKTRVLGGSGELVGAVPAKALPGTNVFYVAATLAGQMTVARFDNDGNLDLSFNGSGFVISSFVGAAQAVDIVQVGTGVVVVGNVVNGGAKDFGLFELDSAGNILSESTVLFSVSRNIATSAFYDGTHLYVGGSVDEGSGERDLALVRMDLAGTLDASFNDQGVFTLDEFSGQNEAVADFVPTADGFVILGTNDAGRDAYTIKVDDAGEVAGYSAITVNANQDGLKPRLVLDPQSTDVIIALRESNTLSLLRTTSSGTQGAYKLFSSLPNFTPAGLLAMSNGQFFTVGTSSSGSKLKLTRHLP